MIYAATYYGNPAKGSTIPLGAGKLINMTPFPLYVPKTVQAGDLRRP